jgi:hypothetical protein
MFLLKRDWSGASVLIVVTTIIAGLSSTSFAMAAADTDPPADDDTYLDHTNQDWVDLPPLLPHTNQDLFDDRSLDELNLLQWLAKHQSSRSERRYGQGVEGEYVPINTAILPQRSIQISFEFTHDFAHVLELDPGADYVMPHEPISNAEIFVPRNVKTDGMQPVIRSLIRLPEAVPGDAGTRGSSGYRGDVVIETTTIPAPGALILLGMAGLLGTHRGTRRRV